MFTMTTTTTNLRKCKYTPHGKDSIYAFFHAWTSEPFQESTFNGDWSWVSYSRAIIEFEDGHIELVSPHEIQFIKD